MKSYNGFYERMLQHDEITTAIREAAERKSGRAVVRNALQNVDAKADEIERIIRSGKWKPPNHQRKKLVEGAHRKERMIERPRWDNEQIVHHILMRPFKEMVMKSLYRYAFGSVPTQIIPLQQPAKRGRRTITALTIKRGPLDAAKVMRRWRDEYKGKKFYAYEGDIKGFYDNIDKDILKAMLSAKIRDRRYLTELFKVIDSSGPGIAKGFYTSPWLAHFYLSPLDNFITQELRPDHYLRYADNLFITHRNKKELHRMVERIEQFLAERLRLEINKNWQVYRFEYRDRRTGKVKGRAINCLGFVIHHNRMTLRKSILKRARGKANRMHRLKRCRRIDAAAIISYMGWVKHTDTYGYYLRHIKPKVNIKYCKRRISKLAKRENREKRKQEAKQNDGLENSSRQQDGEAGGGG